jgi:hypothetical protein
MGMAYRRGSTVVMMGLAQECANRDTLVYPGSGPSTPEVTPLLPALLSIIFTVVTTLLELFGLEAEEEDGSDPLG